jgi:hypothetical protein
MYVLRIPSPVWFLHSCARTHQVCFLRHWYFVFSKEILYTWMTIEVTPFPSPPTTDVPPSQFIQAILNLRNAQGGGENAAFSQNLMWALRPRAVHRACAARVREWKPGSLTGSDVPAEPAIEPAAHATPAKPFAHSFWVFPTETHKKQEQLVARKQEGFEAITTRVERRWICDAWLRKLRTTVELRSQLRIYKSLYILMAKNSFLHTNDQELDS